MSLREVFTGSWELRFPQEPIPTNLAFLDGEADNMTALASVLDSTERMILKLDKELSKQRFIFDFVLERMNASLAARSQRTSDGSGVRGTSPSRHSTSGDIVGEDIKRSKLTGRTSYGQPVRAHGAAAQFAAVMAKFGFSGKVNRPAIDPEDENRTYSLEEGGIRQGKKLTPVSRFYDRVDKSNMYRASSEPSLIDSNIKYKPQPSIPTLPTPSRIPHSLKSTASCVSPANATHSLVGNLHQPVSSTQSSQSSLSKCATLTVPPPKSAGTQNQPDNISPPVVSVEQYLETDIDCVVPSVPLPPRQSQIDLNQVPKQPRKPRSDLYEDPIDFRPMSSGSNLADSDNIDDDGSASSDDEPIYFNLLLLKQETLNQANQLYINVTPLSENSDNRVELRRRRNNAGYEEIFPSASDTSSDGHCVETCKKHEDNEETRSKRYSMEVLLDSDGLSERDTAGYRNKRYSMELALDSDAASQPETEDLDISIPVSPQDEKEHVREGLVRSYLECELHYVTILETLKEFMQKLSNIVQTPQHTISSEDVNTVFYKMTDLHTIHKSFTTDLERQISRGWSRDLQIGPAFYELASRESNISVLYVTNYQKAASAVRRCKQNSPAFVELTRAVKCPPVKHPLTLEEMISEPMGRFERLELILQDLIKVTPTSHADYDSLHKALSFAVKFGCTNSETATVKDSNENMRYLVDNGLVVEQVGVSRKMRHIFLFNDVLVCARQKLCARDRVTFEVKWFLPLDELMMEDDITSQDERQLFEYREQEVNALQRKVSSLRSDLKIEKKRAQTSNELQRQSSFRNHLRNAERIRKKLMEQKAALILASPFLPLRVTHKKTKSYTLLMSSDFERANWRSHIEGLVAKPPSHQNPLSAADIQHLLNDLKLPARQSTMGALLGTDDFSLEEEYLFGSLCITVVSLQGLQQPADVFCCVEVDSFGHFFMKAKTHIVINSQMPYWEADFEIDLDGAQTLRVLCYKKDNEFSQLIGKGAFEMSQNKLCGQPANENIALDNGMTLQTVMCYRSRQQTLKRTLSSAKEGLFGVRLRAVLRREGTKIPIIVTSCVQEIESRGMKDLGLYRVSGVLNEIQKLKKAFEKNSRTAVLLLKNADTNVVSGLLKVYLRELPEALFTDALYSKLLEGIALEEPEAKQKNMLRLMGLLPQSNYPTAMYILDHLIKVSEQEAVNKMTLQNLATVFGPTLLRPAEKEASKQSVEELMSAGARDAMKQIEILLYILRLKQRGTFGIRL